MMRPAVNLPRVRAALARLDALLEAHPELRSEAARTRCGEWLAAYAEVTELHEHQVDLGALGRVDPANDR